VHAQAHVAGGAVGLLVPSKASVGNDGGQAGAGEASSPVEPSKTMPGPDQPAGAVATQTNPAAHAGSAQSIAPLQSSSIPLVQSSGP
jgi:hypothetical protein